MPRLKKSVDTESNVAIEEQPQGGPEEKLVKQADELEAKIAELEAKLAQKKDSSNVDKEIRISKSKKELLMEKLKPFIEEETRLVTGKFRNYETPGGAATITIRKYPGVPEFCESMMDGQVYKVPLYVARFLNGVDVTAPKKKIHTCSYGVHGFTWAPGQNAPENRTDGHGVPVPIIGITGHVQRYGFESMEFDAEI